MLSGLNPSDEVNRQSSAIAKRREQLRRWEESETNRESPSGKLSQRVKFQQAYVFLAACSSSDRDEVEKLLQRAADINTSNIDGLTALHQACIDNNLLMVEFLLTRAADINCQDNEGWTPLHAAASCGNLEIVKYLLSRGATVDVCNNEGELPIDIGEGEEIIAALEEDMRKKGIDDQQARNSEHQLMLKHAQDWLNNNQKSNAKALPETVVHQRTGATALHVAAAKGYLDVIDLLLRAGANINSVDNDGWTPLHAAAHWDKHDIIHFLLEHQADFDAKNYAGQTPLDVCDGVTYELLKEIKDKRPPVKTSANEAPDNILAPWKRKNMPPRPIVEHKSILRSESHNENLESTAKTTSPIPSPSSVSIGTPANLSSVTAVPQPDLPSSSLPLSSSQDENLTNASPSIKEKLNNLQRSLHDLSNRYLKSNQEEPTNASAEQRMKSNSSSTRPTTILSTAKSTPRTFTNPLQSLTAINKNSNQDLLSRETPTTSTSPTSPTPPATETKMNRRWGTSDRPAADGSSTAANNTGPYVRRRSSTNVPESPPTPPTPVVSVTTAVPSPSATANVTVSASTPADDSFNAKRRSNLPPARDEEAEAQRKHRSAQARRERRSTQSVTVEDIKAAEQQIKNTHSNAEPNFAVLPPPAANLLESNLSNNQIGSPTVPSPAEHDIETERLQQVIEEKKDQQARRTNEDTAETTVDAASSSSTAGSRRVRSRFTSADSDNLVPSITANDSLNLGINPSVDSQQQQQQQPRRRTNRVHNQRKNTGRIIWNDETKEVEIRDETNDLVPKSAYPSPASEDSHRSDDQKLQDNVQQQTLANNASRNLVSRFENNPAPPNKDSNLNLARNNRSLSQDPTRKFVTATSSLPTATTTNSTNGMAASTPFGNKKDSKENSLLSQSNPSDSTKRLYEDAKRKAEELTQTVERLEREIAERDQLIEKLKTSQYIESSLDKREKRAYERKISELEEDLKKMDSIKADNTRLKEENAALIRVISKLSK